jgi:hypothetical protein
MEKRLNRFARPGEFRRLAPWRSQPYSVGPLRLIRDKPPHDVIIVGTIPLLLLYARRSTTTMVRLLSVRWTHLLPDQLQGFVSYRRHIYRGGRLIYSMARAPTCVSRLSCGRSLPRPCAALF